MKEAIAAAFPKTKYQRCIVQVRNTLKYVPEKDRKAFAADLKTIYQAPDEKKALAALERVSEKWSSKYPIFSDRTKSNIYNKHDRISKGNLSKAKSTKERISERYSLAESIVSGYL